MQITLTREQELYFICAFDNLQFDRLHNLAEVKGVLSLNDLQLKNIKELERQLNDFMTGNTFGRSNYYDFFRYKSEAKNLLDKLKLNNKLPKDHYFDILEIKVKSEAGFMCSIDDYMKEYK